MPPGKWRRVVIACFCCPLLPFLSAQDRVYTNRAGMEFVLIAAGEFQMGCSPGDNSCYGNEGPLRRAKITKPFYLGKYEVTQEEWQKIMGNNPSYFGEASTGAAWKRHPVEQISWLAVQDFLEKLNSMEKPSSYRLPTEAEWEYAARAGTTDSWSGAAPDRAGWYWQNSGGTTHPVGQQKPNAWGLYDMLGNVWEWVQDNYGEKYYRESPDTDPAGPASGTTKTLKGGSWYWNAKCFRVSYRYSYRPDYADYSGGFRCALEVRR